ncbi:MAG: YdhR family protein [Hyphomicrobiales bacterium]
MPVILQVSFSWDDEEETVRAASLAQALELAARTEFAWKMILRDPPTKTSGAVYMFADRAKAEAWRAELFERRGRGIEARIFEIDAEASRLTRAPIGDAAEGGAAASALPIEQLNASNDE